MQAIVESTWPDTKIWACLMERYKLCLWMTNNYANIRGWASYAVRREHDPEVQLYELMRRVVAVILRDETYSHAWITCINPGGWCIQHYTCSWWCTVLAKSALLMRLYMSLYMRGICSSQLTYYLRVSNNAHLNICVMVWNTTSAYYLFKQKIDCGHVGSNNQCQDHVEQWRRGWASRGWWSSAALTNNAQ